MKVTGFSFIKNAVKFQYPVAEALQSILPLCDEIIVAVGKSEDNTRELVASVHPQKIKIIDTVWDETLREGGSVLAVETDKAFGAIGTDTDWCFYIQGDEVLQDGYYNEIYEAMQRWKEDKKVDGLLFNYRHFYGSFDYIGTSSKWYRHEIRIVKNDKTIYAYRDAQGFRKGRNQKLRVKALPAYIHHYGWVREPKAMQAKSNDFSRLWDGGKETEQTATSEFEYSGTHTLEKFTGTHPAVMRPRIQNATWKFEYDIAHHRLSLKEKAKNWVEKLTGKRPFDYKNYVIV